MRLGIFAVFLRTAVPGVEDHSCHSGKGGDGKAHNTTRCKEKPHDVT